MPELVLDPEQSELVAAAGTPIVVRDASGREVGVLSAAHPSNEAPLSITPEEVEEISRRMADGRRNWPTTQEVVTRIKSRVAS